MAHFAGDLTNATGSGLACIGVRSLNGVPDIETITPFLQAHIDECVWHDPTNGASGVVRLRNGELQSSIDGGKTFDPIGSAEETSINTVSGQLSLSGITDSIEVIQVGSGISISGLFNQASGLMIEEIKAELSGFAPSGAAYIVQSYAGSGNLSEARILNAVSGIRITDYGALSMSGVVISLDADNEPAPEDCIVWGTDGKPTWSGIQGSKFYTHNFNNSTSWGSATAGFYEMVVLASTHNVTDPKIVQVYEDVGSATYDMVQPDRVRIDAASGVLIRVSESPDQRFAGRLEITGK